jgi:hypothetical protein
MPIAFMSRGDAFRDHGIRSDLGVIPDEHIT